MKVIHLNTYDGNGGAGRACYRLNKALQIEGIDNKVFTFVKFGSKADIHSLFPTWFGKAIATCNILAERYLPLFITKDLKLPFSLSFFGRDIHHHPAVLAADIIHLHWINHGFLNPKNLEKLALLGKPIVWTIHDSNTFTGGCHVRFDCENYLQKCGNCPLLKHPKTDDLSHQIWLKKEKAYLVLKPLIISPSVWLANAAKNSGLLKNLIVKVIPNTLETSVFKPIDKRIAKKQFGIDENQFVLLSGFMPSKKDAHKGISYLIAALDLWITQHPELKEKATLLIFGNREAHPNLPFKMPVKFLGTINDDELLAKAYAAADVFLTTSLEDNLPNTVMESLACGTPVVSFTTGGIPDMVVHLQNGYLAQYKNSEDFMKGIQWVYEHPDKEKLNAYARATVMNSFSENVVAKQYIAIYQQLLNK
jgi:glycosyltransferase involved in cell wall biosynthesis